MINMATMAVTTMTATVTVAVVIVMMTSTIRMITITTKVITMSMMLLVAIEICFLSSFYLMLNRLHFILFNYPSTLSLHYSRIYLPLLHPSSFSFSFLRTLSYNLCFQLAAVLSVGNSFLKLWVFKLWILLFSHSLSLPFDEGFSPISTFFQSLPCVPFIHFHIFFQILPLSYKIVYIYACACMCEYVYINCYFNVTKFDWVNISSLNIMPFLKELSHTKKSIIDLCNLRSHFIRICNWIVILKEWGMQNILKKLYNYISLPTLNSITHHSSSNWMQNAITKRFCLETTWYSTWIRLFEDDSQSFVCITTSFQNKCQVHSILIMLGLCLDNACIISLLRFDMAMFYFIMNSLFKLKIDLKCNECSS